MDTARIRAAYDKVRAELLAERTPAGHWEGYLSSSALSTATAVSALAIASHVTGSAADEPLIARGVAYLIAHQNPDGGWGDTDRSHSNIATTMLTVAALHLARQVKRHEQAVARAESYLTRQGGVSGLRARYGTDKTFAVPILTNSALAGLVSWSEVSPLPFEAACLPQRLYRWLRLPVVSYAIPALVAIGQARFVHCGPRFPLIRFVRRAAIAPSLRVLHRMQPPSGGYLEATPLTSFVAMSLAATGRVEEPVTREALRFIRQSVRSDGSWPIDTNLATWTTSLAINALATDPSTPPDVANVDWFLGCQHRARHPFTGADAGGWGWTNLSGAVPDVDDTSGALLACRHWYAQLQSQRVGGERGNDDARGVATFAQRDGEEALADAARHGVRWLLSLQNRDGGWPTFCRGWGKLPFDRSGADLTAHALRALHAWRDVAPRAIDRAARRGWSYLARQQRADGSWVPLWFGNQDHPQEENPVYGTSRVLLAYQELGAGASAAAERGYRWLASAARADGGWGDASCAHGRPGEIGSSSVEETALAVEALAARRSDPALQLPLNKGLQWLTGAILADRHRQCAPIGFYFAKLWYHEKLYPLVFAVAALGRAVHGVGNQMAGP